MNVFLQFKYIKWKLSNSKDFIDVWMGKKKAYRFKRYEGLELEKYVKVWDIITMVTF